MNSQDRERWVFSRQVIMAVITGILVFGTLAALFVILRVGAAEEITIAPADALADSQDACVTCHRAETPGIVQQYGYSTMAAAEVSCRDCHEVHVAYPGAVEHEGTLILGAPTTAMCEECHQQEVAQYYQSRHGLPAYVAVAGARDLSPELLLQYESIPEGLYQPDLSRNAIAELEGPDLIPFTCFGCHDIGQPAVDGSVGQCQSCHLRHTFSLEQARKPETCNACHIGPDHPQYEIYEESPHGIAYHTLGESWHWEAEAGTLDTADFPAATCALCHMSGFGTQATTHDVGDRLAWYLFAPVSTRRPDWDSNQQAMQGVCAECHNQQFLNDFYTAADKATERVNEWVLESQAILAPAQSAGMLTEAPFDQPIDFTYFDLWHHWGRTTKFGTWMQGPDYAQWHGAYEVLHDLAELQEGVDELMAGSEEREP